MNNVPNTPNFNSRTPARLDIVQSISGLILGFFLWVHIILVSSILLGEDAMYFVSGIMEARFLSSGEEGYPILVSLTGIFIFVLFVVHAAVALRKFPSSWKQHKILRDQVSMMRHTDTYLWYTQFLTGFIMFFLGSIHLYMIIIESDQIGPYASADRFVSGHMWPVYFVLLFAVELHATIGMYRLSIKWGIFDGKNPRATRKRLSAIKNFLTVFFLVLGIASFAAYIKIGLAHQDQAGEKYRPGDPALLYPSEETQK